MVIRAHQSGQVYGHTTGHRSRQAALADSPLTGLMIAYTGVELSVLGQVIKAP